MRFAIVFTLLFALCPTLSCGTGQALTPESMAGLLDTFEATSGMLIKRTVQRSPAAKQAWEIVADSVDQVVMPILNAEQPKLESLQSWVRDMSSNTAVNDDQLMVIQSAINLAFSFVPTSRLAETIPPELKGWLIAGFDALSGAIRKGLEGYEPPLTFSGEDAAFPAPSSYDLLLGYQALQ